MGEGERGRGPGAAVRPGVWAWCIGVLAAVLGLLAATGTQREKPVVGGPRAAELAALEAAVATAPTEGERAVRLARLADAYVDVGATGAAVGAVEEASASSRRHVRVEHAYARALLEHGRATDALGAERRVLTTCEAEGCDGWLLVAATRRADILASLTAAGIEDVKAQPEASALAYKSATREARLALR